MSARSLAAAAITLSMLSACGGGGDDDPMPPAPPAPTPAEPEQPTPVEPDPQEPAPVQSADLDRTASRWSVFKSTNAVDGRELTVITSGSSPATFNIQCSAGKVEAYYIRTDFVTASGNVRYRVGHNPVEMGLWTEGSGFRTLFPRQQSAELFKQIYQNWDFSAELRRFSGGAPSVQFGATGFPAVVDKTREQCGWDAYQLPKMNGWDQELPDTPPAHAKETTYQASTDFSMTAWLEPRREGSPQLFVRLMEDKGRCTTGLRSIIDDRRLYVWQDARRVSAVPGFRFGVLCDSSLPFTLALQGDFDTTRPFVLSAYKSHESSLNPGDAFAEARFD